LKLIAASNINTHQSNIEGRRKISDKKCNIFMRMKVGANFGELFMPKNKTLYWLRVGVAPPSTTNPSQVT
jgi:hypothetical protein